jgi:hypothetical protein
MNNSIKYAVALFLGCSLSLSSFAAAGNLGTNYVDLGAF